MSAAIASAITPYGGVHTYLSCKQAYFLNPLVSSSVPRRNSIRHKTAQTCRQSCFGREDYTSCGACRPTPGHGTGTRLKASAVPLYPAVYTPNLLLTTHVAVYTYRRIYNYTDIRLHTLHLRCLFYTHFYLSFHFCFWFRPHFSSACSHPSTFILQRYRRQGTRQTPECSLLAENFSWPSEIKDCGFLKTLPANSLP